MRCIEIGSGSKISGWRVAVETHVVGYNHVAPQCSDMIQQMVLRQVRDRSMTAAIIMFRRCAAPPQRLQNGTLGDGSKEGHRREPEGDGRVDDVGRRGGCTAVQSTSSTSLLVLWLDFGHDKSLSIDALHCSGSDLWPLHRGAGRRRKPKSDPGLLRWFTALQRRERPPFATILSVGTGATAH